MKKKQEIKMGLIMSVVISAAMGAVASFLVLRSNPQAARIIAKPTMYLSNIVLSIVTGGLTASLIPLSKYGNMLARKAGTNPPEIRYMLINSIPITVGNTLIVGTVLSLLGVFAARANVPPEVYFELPPVHVMWFSGWIELLLPMFIISYILSVMLSPIAARMVGLAGPDAAVETR